MFVQVDKPPIRGLLCILRRAVAMATPQPHKLPCLRWIDWTFPHQILMGDRPVSVRTTAGRTMDMFQAHTGMICYSSVIAICRYLAPSRRPVWSDVTSIDALFICAVERGLVVGFCGRPHYCHWPYYPTARLRSPSSFTVSDEPFLDTVDRSSPMSC